MADGQWVEGHELQGSPESGWVEGHELQAAPAPGPTTNAVGLQEGGTADAIRRGLTQGVTAGFGDELVGALGAPVVKGYRALIGAAPQSWGDTYRALRDADRTGNADAEKRHKAAYLASLVGGGVITSFAPGASLLNAGKGATLPMTLAKGAAQGATMGLGGSDADLTRGEVGRAALDTLAGAGTGAALSYGGYRLGKFGQKAGEEVRMANADAAQAAAQKAQKAVDSTRGALGGDVASVLDAAKSYEHAIASPLATAEQKAAAKAALEAPEFQALYQHALNNKLELTAEKMGGRLLNSRAAYQTAQAARTPEAVEKAAAESMANPLRRQVLPRLKMYGERMVPALVGMHMGGIPGALAGTAMGLVMGKPGTAMANMVKNPGVRAAMWSGLGTGANALQSAAQHSVGAGSLALSPQIAAMVAALRGRPPQSDAPEWTPEPTP